MKITYSITVEVSDREVEFLKKFENSKYAVFQDTGFDTLSDWQLRNNRLDKDDAYFLERNFGGYCREAYSCESKGLVEHVRDAWYTTFIITQKGEEILGEIKKRTEK